jgi:DNA-binding NarL/FixJ family response regulator
MTIRVLLADDEELVRVAVRVLVEAEPDLTVVGEAVDGVEIVPLVHRLRPDVVVMDVRMPVVNGIEATRRIVDTASVPPKILILTTFENDEYVYEALRAGASGFLLKRARPDEIVQTIRLLATGDSLLFPAAIRRLAANHRTGTAAHPVLAGLTEREADVLRHMAQGLSNSEIAQRLYIGVQTVKTHVSSLLTKLGARDRTQAVIAAYESGFLDPD